MNKTDRLDVIIFGASGFTGKYTVFEGVKILRGLKWGIAGRSKDKLQQVLKDIGAKAKIDLSAIPLIVADINDQSSIKAMTSMAKVIVNCCGPYRFYGEVVVKSCIETKTHHVDVSGEPQFMERMQLEYNEAAREQGVYIISACGFDSIPADMGTIYLEKQFGGVVNSVETYLRSYFDGEQPPPAGAGIHYGTWESAVYGLAHANELRGLRTKLYPTRLPRFEPKLNNRSFIHNSNFVGDRWCLPFPGSDRSVVLRTQRHFYDYEKKRPIQMQAYIAFDSLAHIFGVVMIAIIFGVLTKFSFGRKLLLRHPKLFSLGFVSHAGPKEESMENTLFEMIFYGEGWKKKLLNPEDKYVDPINKTIITKVTGRNPGYGSTCIALLLSAITILKENFKMPETGGVFSPGAAFAKTNIISELCNNGFTFEVLSENSNV